MNIYKIKYKGGSYNLIIYLPKVINYLIHLLKNNYKHTMSINMK